MASIPSITSEPSGEASIHRNIPQSPRGASEGPGTWLWDEGSHRASVHPAALTVVTLSPLGPGPHSAGFPVSRLAPSALGRGPAVQLLSQLPPLTSLQSPLPDLPRRPTMSRRRDSEGGRQRGEIVQTVGGGPRPAPRGPTEGGAGGCWRRSDARGPARS